MSPIFQPQPPVEMRPLAPRYRLADTPDMLPDLIVNMPDLGDIKNISYLCYRYLGVAKMTNCWRIARVATEFISDGTPTPVETQTIKYPFGSEGYNFNPDHIQLLHMEPVWLDWQFDYKW